MKQKTLQEQYNLIKEGKGNAEVFMKAAKKQFPNFVRNAATLNETISSLKHNHIISESMLGLGMVSSTKPTTPDWFKIFNENMEVVAEEAKAVEKKPTKDVVDLETKGYDYKDKENVNNVYGESFLEGYYAEMKDPKNADKTVDELKDIVAKNLAKDRLYYTKEAQFGIKGIGYTDQTPGLKASESDKMVPVKESINEAKLTKVTKQMWDEMDEDERVDALLTAYKDPNDAEKYFDTKWEDLPTVATQNMAVISEIGMFMDPVGYDKNAKSRIEVAKDILKDAGLSEEERDAFISSNMFKSGRIDDRAKEYVSTLNEAKKPKKETANSKLAEIEKNGKIATLEIQIDALDEIIEAKNQRISMVTEDENLSELVDKNKMKEMQREIKELEKRKAKMEKLYEKMCGKKYAKKEVVGEDYDPDEEQKRDEDEIFMAYDDEGKPL